MAIVVEKLEIYTQHVRGIISLLKGQYTLEEWESWQRYKNVFETQIDFLETCNAKKVCGNSDKDTMDMLHTLRSRITLLDPSRLIAPPASDSKIQKLLCTIQTDHQEITQTLQQAYQNGENICHPQFDINRDVARIMRKNGIEMEDIVYYSNKLR